MKDMNFTEVACYHLCTVSSFCPQCFVISSERFVSKFRCRVFGDFATKNCEDVHISQFIPVCLSIHLSACTNSAQRGFLTFETWQFSFLLKFTDILRSKWHTTDTLRKNLHAFVQNISNKTYRKNEMHILCSLHLLL
jgi:hypothetical protein